MIHTTDKNDIERPKVKTVILLVELEEGGIHQVGLKAETQQQLLNILAQIDGYIKVIDKPIDGLYINKNID